MKRFTFFIFLSTFNMIKHTNKANVARANVKKQPISGVFPLAITAVIYHQEKHCSLVYCIDILYGSFFNKKVKAEQGKAANYQGTHSLFQNHKCQSVTASTTIQMHENKWTPAIKKPSASLSRISFGILAK